MESLYEYLEHELQMNTPEVVMDSVFNLKYSEMENLIERLFQEIHVENPENNISIFDFKVNSTLAGGKYPCNNINCRMDRLAELMRFSSLYADHVYIISPIDKYITSLGSEDEIDRYELAADIIILLELKALVINRIIIFQSEYICLCDNCSKKYHRDKELFINNIDKGYNRLLEKCSTKIKCKLLKKENIEIHISNAEDYGYYHDTVISFRHYIPENIKRKLAVSISNNISLNPNDILSLGISDLLINNAYEDVFKNFIYEKSSNISYLTDRRIDFSLLNYVNGESNSNFNLLDHSLSILPNVKISDIIELRMKEGESFKVYRDKLNKELRKLDNPTKSEAIDFQRDIIQPEINKMNLTLKNNKKFLMRNLKQELIFWSSTISVGMLSGRISNDMTSVLGTLGGASTLYHLYNDYREMNSDSSIKNEPFYFLWKLNN